MTNAWLIILTDNALVFVIALVVIPIATILYGVMTMSDEVKYCFIENGNSGYRLSAARDWRPSTAIVHFSTLEDARAAAQKLNCELK